MEYAVAVILPFAEVVSGVREVLEVHCQAARAVRRLDVVDHLGDRDHQGVRPLVRRVFRA